MAEGLQAFAAAVDVAKLALEGYKFLHKVKQADQIVQEVYDRTLRLRKVIENVKFVLIAREERDVSAKGTVENQTEENITDCLLACKAVLRQISDQVGGFNLIDNDPGLAVFTRVKIALRHPSVTRLQNDLEARISALQADLLILQLSDQAHTHTTLHGDYKEVRQMLVDLREQLDVNTRLLHNLQCENQLHGTTADAIAMPTEEAAVDAAAIESLECGVRIGVDLHERYTERYTSENVSDHSSVRSGDDSPMAGVPHESGEGEEDGGGTYPLEILDGFIQAEIDQAAKEQEQSHFNQAEALLQSALKYSEDRERHYGVAFTNKAVVHEEIARLYQKQGKSADAVAKVHYLLNSATESDPWVIARQQQLLASIYFDRYQNRPGSVPNSVSEDLKQAEGYAKKAYTAQYHLLQQQEVSDEEFERHAVCTDLVARILEAYNNNVEANFLKKIITEGNSSLASRSVKESSIRPNNDSVGNQQSLLIEAIRSGDSELVDDLLKDGEIEIEKRCGRGRTLLIWAVRSEDETIVNKLLNPEVAAQINGTDKNEWTALHHAASLGLLGMVRFLLHHDADIEAKDEGGETPLLKAVQTDERHVVQELYDNVASFEARGKDKWSILHFAVGLKSTRMVKQILDLCPDLKDAIDTAGKTALHYCAERGRVEHATVLLTHRNHVDVSVVDSAGRSALYLAASKAPSPTREQMVALLVKQGARIDASRLPPRWHDYPALDQFQLPKQTRKLSRRESVSTHATADTAGTVGTVSTILSRVSSIFSKKKKHSV